MKRQIMIFLGVQLLFGILLSSVMILFSQTEGLQPFNSKNNTVHINLNGEISISEAMRIADENKLNLAYYEEQDDKYYIRFHSIDNPERIYGAPSVEFLSSTFYGNRCAGTEKNNCQIRLSTPNKTKKILILPLDNLDAEKIVSNLILYPNSTDNAEETKSLFIINYPKAIFTVVSDMPNNIIQFLSYFFIFLTVLVLLSVIQAMYKKGSEIGIQKMFGMKFFVRHIKLTGGIFISIVSGLVCLYVIIALFVTTDYSYLQYLYWYVIVSLVILFLAINYTSFLINLTPINLLVKGKKGNKIVMFSFIALSSVLIILTGALIPTVAINIKKLSGEIVNLQYYEQDMKNSGIIPLRESTIVKYLQRDPEFIVNNEAFMTEISDFLEYKKKSLVVYPEHQEMTFPTFTLNKKLIHKYFGDTMDGIEHDNTNKVYIFVDDSTEQKKELDALSYYFTKNAKKPKEVEFIQYKKELREYIKDETYMEKSVVKYEEINSPIYVYQAGLESYEDAIFATETAGGYSFSMDSETAKEQWSNISSLLDRHNLTEYFQDPTTLDVLQKDYIENLWLVIYVTGIIFVASSIGIILLILVSVDEYFRVSRYNLVLKKLFGKRFIERYLLVILYPNILLTVSWIVATFIYREYSYLSLGVYIVVLINIICLLINRIRKLELEAINLVIKE